MSNKTAPVLVLGVVNLRFVLNCKDNRAAVHDLGLASANLVIEATSRHLSAHQMIASSRRRPVSSIGFRTIPKRGPPLPSATPPTQPACRTRSGSGTLRPGDENN